MPTKKTTSDFDADQFMEALQQIIQTPPPPKKASATETIKKNATELRALIAKGWTHEELAKAFAEKGVKISAATLQKAIAKKRLKNGRKEHNDAQNATTKAIEAEQVTSDPSSHVPTALL